MEKTSLLCINPKENKGGLVAFPPCVGCGYCCIQNPCFRSAYFGWCVNEKGICDRLFWNKGRYWCQEVIDNPKEMVSLGIGKGCPSVLGNKWRKNIKRRDEK